MKKKYTLQLVNFQIKTYYNKAFKLLKLNQQLSLYANDNYKRVMIKHFFRICLEDRAKLGQKAGMLSFFSRVIQLKYAYSSIKRLLLQKKEAKRLRCYFLSVQLRLFYQQLIANIPFRSARRLLHIQYNIFFVKRIYITFFKSVCKYISSRGRRMKKYNDANELYLFKLTIKALRKLKENVSLSQKSAGIRLRKRLIMRIYYKNLKAVFIEERKRSNYYRRLHLKKYYFHRLSRVVKAMGNNRIAKLKFISKWIIRWKELLLRNKRSKAESVVLLSRASDKIKIKYIVKGLRRFYRNFKEKNLSLKKMQLNDIKCARFTVSRLKGMKQSILIELKYNMLIRQFTNKRNFLQAKRIFQMLKFIKDTSIPMYLKEEEALSHYKKKAYRKVIKPYFAFLRKSASMKKAKVQFFRVTMLKIKIFKQLKAFKAKSKKENDRRERRFRQYFLMYRFMSMMKTHSLIIYRENKIISGLKRKIAQSRLSYMKWGFRSIRNNLLVKRCKRRKMFKLIIQVFTAMKMLSKQQSSRLGNRSDPDDYEEGEEYN